MYEPFYGFDESPFRLSADNKLCFYHQSYVKAFKCAVSALEEGKSFITICGRPGMGKTTLCGDIISHFDSKDVQTVNILASHLDADELLRKVALDLDLSAEKYDRATILSSLKSYMEQLCRANKRLIIFLDEAQNLSVNSIQDLDQLAGLVEGAHAVPQTVLVGHVGLREMMSDAGARPVQRLAVSCELESMTSCQTEEYALHRLDRVGWKGDPGFSDSVFRLLHEATRGTPRLINHVMNRLLQIAAFRHLHQVGEEELLLAIQLLVEEDRLSLINGESFTAFKQRYLAAKVVSTAQCGSTKIDGEALADDAHHQLFPALNRDMAKTHTALDEDDVSINTRDAVTDEDGFGLQYDDVDFPDTDLLDWDEDEPQHQTVRTTQKGRGSYLGPTGPDPGQLSKREYKRANTGESEHQWGGVWWMSDNTHKGSKGSSIVVDDLPIVEIEECPEMSATLTPALEHGRGGSRRVYALKLSVILALSLTTIGSLVVLFLGFVP